MKLKKNLKLPLDKFIDLSLYNENFGYYMKKNPFGKKGYFITAPNISRLFSEILLALNKFVVPIKFAENAVFGLE